MFSEDETVRYEYDRLIGTKRLYAAITCTVRPHNDKNTPVLSYKKIANELSHEERVALEEAFSGSISRGPLGYPVVGFDVEIVKLERNPHTCAGSIRACVSMFLSSVLKGEESCLLEPIMSLEIYLPSLYLGEVLSDLSAKRRGFIKEVRTEDATSIIIGHVPLVTMLGYATVIRSMTQGEGSFSLEYLDHAVVDASVQL